MPISHNFVGNIRIHASSSTGIRSKSLRFFVGLMYDAKHPFYLQHSKTSEVDLILLLDEKSEIKVVCRRGVYPYIKCLIKIDLCENCMHVTLIITNLDYI